MVLNYFAYGSNLFTPRLVQRVPSARIHKIAVLPGHELRFHKNGADGSAKANAYYTNDERHEVHGVLYRMDAAERYQLDQCEGGYDCCEVEVETDSGMEAAFTYIAQSHLLDERLDPFHWYKAYVHLGAEQHGLLPEYVAGIRRYQSVTDPNSQREAEHFEIVGLSVSEYVTG